VAFVSQKKKNSGANASNWLLRVKSRFGDHEHVTKKSDAGGSLLFKKTVEWGKGVERNMEGWGGCQEKKEKEKAAIK